MRPSEILRRAEDYLAHHGVESARENAETLLMSVLGVDRVSLYSRTTPLAVVEARSFGRALCQRAKGIPLQHLTGEQEFRHLMLEVHPGVFIPRPETEVLVDRALELLADSSSIPVVVDVGTGTGAIALSIKKERPDAKVVATDVSGEAVWLAGRNAARLSLDLEVHEGDLLSAVPHELKGRVDLVVSNPPYVTREEYDELPDEVRADPKSALVGGTLFHRALVEQAPRWLRHGGWLLVEIGDRQADEVAGLFAEHFAEVHVSRDLADRDRLVSGYHA